VAGTGWGVLVVAAAAVAGPRWAVRTLVTVAVATGAMRGAWVIETLGVPAPEAGTNPAITHGVHLVLVVTGALGAAAATALIIGAARTDAPHPPAHRAAGAAHHHC